MPSTAHESPGQSRGQAAATPLMPLADPPGEWQRRLGDSIVQALEKALRQPAPVHDAAPPARPSLRIDTRTRWPRAARWSDGLDAWARCLAPSRPQVALYARCLRHHSQYFADPHAAQADPGVAVAGFLAASLQALEWHAVTPLRWHALAQWLDRHVVLPEPHDAAALQSLCVRMALLTVAIGEWSQQASAQGAVAQASAELMARQHLQGELGIDAALLLRAMRWHHVIPQQSLREPGAAAALPN